MTECRYCFCSDLAVAQLRDYFRPDCFRTYWYGTDDPSGSCNIAIEPKHVIGAVVDAYVYLLSEGMKRTVALHYSNCYNLFSMQPFFW